MKPATSSAGAFAVPKGLYFFMESDRGLAPITILMSNVFPYVVTLGAARTETVLTALIGFMNEDSEKDLG